MTAEDLVAAALLPTTRPRVRACLVPLFILRPELATVARRLARVRRARPTPNGPVPRSGQPPRRARGRPSRGLGPHQRVLLRLYYTAAVYLQCIWRPRLARTIGPAGDLPDLFSAELGLPPPGEYHGLVGLACLAQTAERMGGPVRLVSEGHAMVRLLMESRERAAGQPTDAVGTP